MGGVVGAEARGLAGWRGHWKRVRSMNDQARLCLRTGQVLEGSSWVRNSSVAQGQAHMNPGSRQRLCPGLVAGTSRHPAGLSWTQAPWG